MNYRNGLCLFFFELVFEKLLTGPVGHMIDEMEGRSDY